MLTHKPQVCCQLPPRKKHVLAVSPFQETDTVVPEQMVTVPKIVPKGTYSGSKMAQLLT